MAQLEQSFNADVVDPRQRDATLLPEGTYRVEVTDSEVKATKDGTGERLNLTLRVYEGEHEGETFWHGLNIKNKNPKAQEIAERELSAICHAVDVLALEDTEQLHFKPFFAKVKTEKGTLKDKSAGPDSEKHPDKSVLGKIYWEGLDAPAASTAPKTVAPNPTPKETPKAAVIAATKPEPSGRKPWK